jgi:putative FmdB family regulatory protein
VPIYEYRCLECGFQDEFLQKVSEPQLTVCPTCGKESFRKLVSAAGFQLKGSGWYATDFKNSGTKPSKSGSGAKPEANNEGSKESASEAKSETKPDSKSDTKPDTKSETKSEAAAA